MGNGDSSQELVQFFVITDGQWQVTGMILVFLLSQAALPANSRTSAAVLYLKVREENTISIVFHVIFSNISGLWVLIGPRLDNL